jgi:hypothetical protein
MPDPIGMPTPDPNCNALVQRGMVVNVTSGSVVVSGAGGEITDGLYVLTRATLLLRAGSVPPITVRATMEKRGNMLNFVTDDGTQSPQRSTNEILVNGAEMTIHTLCSAPAQVSTEFSQATYTASPNELRIIVAPNGQADGGVEEVYTKLGP